MMDIFELLPRVYLTLHASPSIDIAFNKKFNLKDNTFILSGQDFLDGFYSLADDAYDATIKHSSDIYTPERIAAFLLLSALAQKQNPSIKSNKSTGGSNNLRGYYKVPMMDWELREIGSDELLDSSYRGSFVGSPDYYIRIQQARNISLLKENQSRYVRSSDTMRKISFKFNTTILPGYKSEVIPCKYLASSSNNISQFLTLCDGFFVPNENRGEYIDVHNFEDDSTELPFQYENIGSGVFISTASKKPKQVKTQVSIYNSGLFLLGCILSDDSDIPF